MILKISRNEKKVYGTWYCKSGSGLQKYYGVLIMRGSTVFGFAVLTVLFSEIAILIFVGSRIGILTTFFLLFLSVCGGVFLLCRQNRGFFSRLQADFKEDRTLVRYPGDYPGWNEVWNIIVAFLLILPGFLSDILGLLLLFIPQIRILLCYCFLKKTPDKIYEVKVDNFETEIHDWDGEKYHSVDPKKSPWREP